MVSLVIPRQGRSPRVNSKPGNPLSDVDVLNQEKPGRLPGSSGVKTMSEIIFVRNRMLYARASLNAHGVVHFGLRHIRKILLLHSL